VKIKHVTIRGFRGFEEANEIHFDEKLTLISAPNSHGKTSISEALEWLIYGATSKVDLADSKDEYKGSYRNVHLPENENSSVSLRIGDSNGEEELRAELCGTAIRMSVDGAEVSRWPFHYSLVKAPKPFILQHALRDLLLASPVDRFVRFAQLLGLSELGNVHKDLLALCTKPPLPEPVRKLRADVGAVVQRAAAQANLQDVVKELKKGIPGQEKAYDLVTKKCKKHVPNGTNEKSLLPELLKARDGAVRKVFSKKVTLEPFTPEEDQQNLTDHNSLTQTLSEDLIRRYVDLIGLKATRHIRDLAELHDIGIRLLKEAPAVCPLCDRSIDDQLKTHIETKHRDLLVQSQAHRNLEKQKEDVESTIEILTNTLLAYHTRITNKVKSLLDLESSLDDLRTLLGTKHEVHYEAVRSAITYLEGTTSALAEQYSRVVSELDTVRQSVEISNESADAINRLSESLVKYLSFAKSHKQVIAAHEHAVSEAAKVLRFQLDQLAGTQDVSILIDLLERRTEVRKKARIDEILENLKTMKQEVDTFMSTTMLEAISGKFGNEVMEWYGKIKTTGDPEVHFSGFDMKRTAAGGRVQIKARSYGKDLVSAVSSLSESKLNALGLCITIAINMGTPSPFDFLVIDDPIQSWDAEHETKFIEVLRQLVANGKQVILLSHNGKWMKQVREQCADLNGLAYEITGFTEEGPHVKNLPWAEVRHRMDTIKGILDNPASDMVAIQHAEEEIRFVMTQLSADLHLKTTGKRKNPNKLNGDEVKKALLAAGIEPEFTNKLFGAFTTVDDSHHAAPDYATHRERIRTYYGWLTTLEDRIRSAPKTTRM
jgi:energy-coupling factor transporter ATP-binding protein EcfA2